MKSKNEQERSRGDPRFGRKCVSISDKEEKLRCFEEMFSNERQEFKEEFKNGEFDHDKDNQEFRKNREFPEQCKKAGSPEECSRYAQEYREEFSTDPISHDQSMLSGDNQQSQQPQEESNELVQTEEDLSSEALVPEHISEDREETQQESPPEQEQPITGSVVFDVGGNKFLKYYFR